MPVSNEPTYLGNNIFLFEPCSDQSKQSLYGERSPSLIILCTWLGGATTDRITKYTSQYQRIYPNAHILLIRTVFLDITTRSFKAIRARLSPAREAISKILQEPQQQKGKISSESEKNDVLLHIFSHGGCNTAIQLAISMYEASGTLFRNHLGLIVFDCCPGDTTFEKAYSAALLSLPPRIGWQAPVNVLGSAVAFSTIAIINGLQNAGLMHSVREMRAQLNDASVFGTRACRLYLYSAADRMVETADVESHAKHAQKNGCQVWKILFTEAPHCGLVLEDAEKYWGSIEELWNKSFKILKTTAKL